MNANKQSKLSNWLSKLSNGQQQQQQQLEQNVVAVSDSNSENILDNNNNNPIFKYLTIQLNIKTKFVFIPINTTCNFDQINIKFYANLQSL